MENKKLYVAYGSNLNIKQMQHRCPTAKLLGVGRIKGYELQFKGREYGAFATIGQNEEKEVPVCLWEISGLDEKYLDRYEGYPSHYFKRNITVEMENGEAVRGMVYIMNQRMDFGLPMNNYYATVYEGYLDCGLDTSFLRDALSTSTMAFYDAEVYGLNEETEYEEDEEQNEEEDVKDCDEAEDMQCGLDSL